MKIFRCILASVIIMLTLSAYCWFPRPTEEGEIENTAPITTPTPEPIDRVKLLRETYPEDWEPQYVYSEPGHIAYPEVMERMAKEQERAKQNALERYMAEREAQKGNR